MSRPTRPNTRAHDPLNKTTDKEIIESINDRWQLDAGIERHDRQDTTLFKTSYKKNQIK